MLVRIQHPAPFINFKEKNRMMNIIKAGSRYQIYGEDLNTYDKLPVRSYDVAFHKMQGFFLVARPDLIVKEEKVYGNHRQRVQKVMRSFRQADRNFGVILSGQKGIGKSLMARLLAEEGIANGLPVITVTDYIPGIASFLGSIEQEVIVIFDEFEKTFGKIDDQPDPQEEMLSLFDGLDGGKKLFVITCNEVRRLNEFMVDRPGRFHYHFRMGAPTDGEIKEYMEDKLQKEYWGEINRIVNFSRTTEVTYDYLRAIAFDLNQGYSLEDCLADLNISGTTRNYYDMTAYFADGSVYTIMNYSINLCDRGMDWVWLRNMNHISQHKDKHVHFGFSPADIQLVNGELIIPVDKVQIDRDDGDDWEKDEAEVKDLEQQFKSRQVVRVTLEKCINYNRERFLV